MVKFIDIPKLFGDGVLGQPRGWAEAEGHCQEMGSNLHLASVTSEEQQRAVAHIATSVLVVPGVVVAHCNIAVGNR